jgi:hypothetical protein
MVSIIGYTCDCTKNSRTVVWIRSLSNNKAYYLEMIRYWYNNFLTSYIKCIVYSIFNNVYL